MQDCVRKCVCCLDLVAPQLSLGSKMEREMEGAVQGDQEGKVDKWLIAFHSHLRDRRGERRTATLRDGKVEEERNAK